MADSTESERGDASTTILDELEAELGDGTRPWKLSLETADFRALLAVARAVELEIAWCPLRVRAALAPLLRPAEE